MFSQVDAQDFIRYIACYRYDFIEHPEHVGRFFFIFIHGLRYLVCTKYLQIRIHQVPISCVLDIITYLKSYSSLKALKAYLPKFFVLSVVPAQLEPHPPILMKLIFHTFPLLPVNNIYSVTNIFLLLSQIILV